MFLKYIPINEVLDLQKSGYNAKKVNEFFINLGEDGRTEYIRNLWTLDLVFPILAAVSSVLLMLYCIFRIGIFKQWLLILAFIPLGIMLCDYIENILITIILSGYPQIDSNLVYWASLFTQIKWRGISVGFTISIVMVTLLIIISIVRKLRKIRLLRLTKS